MHTLGRLGCILVFAILSNAASAATANDRHGREHGDGDFAAWHASMCKERFAREVGRTAYFEAALDLSNAQEPLFAAWKDARLQDAKERLGKCASETPPAQRPTFLDHMNREQARLSARLASLQAELPPLTALYQSLSPEQKRVFDRMHGHGMHDGGMREGMQGGDGHDRDGRHDGERRPDRAT